MTTWYNYKSKELAQYEGDSILIDVSHPLKIVEEENNARIREFTENLTDNYENGGASAEGILLKGTDGFYAIIAIWSMYQDYWISIPVKFEWWTPVPKFSDANAGG